MRTWIVFAFLILAGSSFGYAQGLSQSISPSENNQAAAAANSPSGKPSYYVANTKPPDAFLSLRTEPSTTAGRRIAQIPNGTELKVLMKRPDRWWHVRVITTGQEGWALSGQGTVTWIECCTTTAGVRTPDQSQQYSPGSPSAADKSSDNVKATANEKIIESAAAASPLPLVAGDPPEARYVLRALEETFPLSKFCRTPTKGKARPMKVVKLGNDEWAMVSFFDIATCTGRSDYPSYTAILRRDQTDTWIIKCNWQYGDLPEYDEYFKRCGLPREAYGVLFGVQPTAQSAAPTPVQPQTTRHAAPAPVTVDSSGPRPNQADVTNQVMRKLNVTGLGGECNQQNVRFEYSNVQVIGHSIDGNNDVVLINVTSTFVGPSNGAFGPICGHRRGILSPSDLLKDRQQVLQVSAHFRRFDTGWIIESFTADF